MIHHTDSYLLYPPHKVTVDLVGLGGTGSQVLTNLARINEALVALGHPGLHVRAWDHDIVSAANVGRQLFSPADIGSNKAVVLITRLNRFFGYDWQAEPQAYTGQKSSNITISCVDTAVARLMISMRIEGRKRQMSSNPTDRLMYWLDLGNLQHTGQVILGTLFPVKQPKNETKVAPTMKTVTKKFNLKKVKEENQGPSCSLAEALQKQDLFINSTLAQFGCNLIWKLIREGQIRYHGCYVNLETLSVNPIRI
ncbi:MAG: PRTRC system ThiF family protein [Chitinophagaceae bacterium]|nr:MAG: PRTRC system ThiF family protein [Chitinophagaceae bacterium]